MSSHQPLSLLHRFESPNPLLPNLGRFMTLLSPIVLVLLSTVDRLCYPFSVRNSIAPKLVRHDLAWLPTAASY